MFSKTTQTAEVKLAKNQVLKIVSSFFFDKLILSNIKYLKQVPLASIFLSFYMQVSGLRV